MNYRKNNRNGDMLSILGYGCLRFPQKGTAVDEERTMAQMIAAIEGGVNYFDTAYIYYNGKSETLLGKVLALGYRDRVKVATKLPTFLVRRAADIDRMFGIQLERLQTDYIDYYLFHMLADVAAWERLKSFGILEWIAEKKKSGQILNIGFSYHGGTEEFIKLIDVYDWDMCQIQYNYMDEHNQAGKAGLQYAASKGIPVVVMEPLRGGKIVTSLPREVNEIWAHAEPKRSVAEWALRWIWNHEEVTVVLSGMSTEEQIAENIRVASGVQPNEMTEGELDLFRKAGEILRKTNRVPCTACRYCMPCPRGVDIPGCFSVYNEKPLFGGLRARKKYIIQLRAMAKEPAIASQCVQCRKCEQHCPQGIAISERLKDVSKEMEGVLFRPAMALARKFTQ